MPSQPAIVPRAVTGPDAVARFAEDGYLVLPGFLPDSLVSRLRSEADTWVDDGLRSRSIASCTDPQTYGVPPVLELELAAHGELLTHAPLLTLLEQLMDGPFVFHHLHSDRQAPHTPGKPWHHDYEQCPQTDRDHAMVHALHYLDGLDEDVSALAVLPGSHREIVDKSARVHLGTDELPYEHTVERLPAGSTVLLHSALFHTRRPRPQPSTRARYFVDASYCGTGTSWPPVKPYWRHMLRRGRELGLDTDQSGRAWPELFSERHFLEYQGAAGTSATRSRQPR